MSVLDTLRGKYPKMLSVLELQQFSRVLAARFVEFDRTGTMALALPDFLLFAAVPRNRVTERLFAVSDADGTGTLDFREACYLVWQLCTLDDKGLIAFLFDLYDEFNNGLVEFDDVTRMLGDSYGEKNLEKEDVQTFVDWVKSKGVITRAEFADMCVRTPQVSRSIMDVQRRMRLHVLSPAAWAVLERRRREKTDPVFRPENWARLIEKIIIMDIEARAEQAKIDKEMEMKTGRRAKRGNVKDAKVTDEKVRYEP